MKYCSEKTKENIISPKDVYLLIGEEKFYQGTLRANDLHGFRSFYRWKREPIISLLQKISALIGEKLALSEWIKDRKKFDKIIQKKLEKTPQLPHTPVDCLSSFGCNICNIWGKL